MAETKKTTKTKAPKVTVVAPSLSTQAKLDGGRIVVKVGNVTLKGLEGRNPEARIRRIVNACRKAEVIDPKQATTIKARIVKATSATYTSATDVRGMGADDVAALIS